MFVGGGFTHSLVGGCIVIQIKYVGGAHLWRYKCFFGHKGRKRRRRRGKTNLVAVVRMEGACIVGVSCVSNRFSDVEQEQKAINCCNDRAGEEGGRGGGNINSKYIPIEC